MELSFVIPHRQEGDWLDWTIAGIREACPTSEILAVEDSPPVGISYQRHRGILEAKNDIVICADAHILLGPGFRDEVLSWLSDNPKDVACFQTKSLEHGSRRVCGGGRFGANLKEIDAGKPFVSQWCYNSTHGVECANVLGGVYAFRKSWYLDGLNGVWRHHRAWGKSEQLLSLMNYLCGGRNICLGDIWAAHYFKRHMKTRPFSLDMRLIRRNWMLIAWGMIDNENRKRIFNLLYGEGTTPDFGRKELDRIGAVADIQSFLLRNAVNNYSSYRDSFLICT